MRSTRLVIISSIVITGMVGMVFCLCALLAATLRPYLSSPEEDTVNRSWHQGLTGGSDVPELRAQYTLAQDVVDNWSPYAYLYGLGFHAPCGDVTAPDKVSFFFLKVNHLGIYPKQWYARVTLDFVQDKVELQVEKEDQDPPPPLRSKLDLSDVRISPPEAIEIASETMMNEAGCRDVYAFLYKNIWDITHLYISDGDISRTYSHLRIDAITGEVQE